MKTSELKEILAAHPSYSVGIGSMISFAPVWIDERIDVLGLDFKFRNDPYIIINISGKEGKEPYETAEQMLVDLNRCFGDATVLFRNDDDEECVARVIVNNIAQTITIY